MQLVRRSIQVIATQLYVLLDYTFDSSAEFRALLSGTRRIPGAFITVLVDGAVHSFIGTSMVARTVDEMPYSLIPAGNHAILAAPAQGLVEIQVQGRQWHMTMGDRRKSGRVAGANHEAILKATIDALNSLAETDGVYAKRLAVRNQNVQKMLKGEMMSHKHPELLRQARKLLEEKKVVLA